MKAKWMFTLLATGGMAFAQDIDLNTLQMDLRGAEQALHQLRFLDQAGEGGGDDEGHDRSYARGVRALDKNQFEDAIHNFDAEIAAKGSRADGATYWKAYAQNQLGRRSAALATIAELRRRFPNSRWLNDGNALELEVRAQEGKPVSPASESNDEMKLIALNALMQSDPNQAIPILRKLLNSSQSPVIKDKAMFVLSQANSADARQVIKELANGGNPDLQSSAIRYMSMMGGDWSRAELATEYRASSDPHVKREIIHGFLLSGAKDKLLEVARGEKDPELRQQAIQTLAQTGGKDELWTLFQSEQNVELRRQIVKAMMLDGDSSHLLTIAKTDHDLSLRKQAIETLSLTGWGKDSGEMANLYRSETDGGLKRALVNGMFLQGNAKGLVEIARQEKDPELKREIVSKLALMHSKESTDYMMEILK